MELEITYKVPSLFTMGELRSIVAQNEGLPEDAEVSLYGQDTSELKGNNGSDAIVIVWLDA